MFNNPASFLLAIVLAGALIAFADASTVLVDWDLSLMVNVGFLNFRLTAFTVLFVVAVVVVGGYLGSQLFALYLFVIHHPPQAPHACVLVPAPGGLPQLPAYQGRAGRRADDLPGGRAAGPQELAAGARPSAARAGLRTHRPPLGTHLIEAPIRIEPS